MTLAIPTDAPGVTAVDDWDAFGQTLTASGTTTFAGVEVDPATVTAYREAPLSHIQAFYQLYLVAVLAGIAQEVEHDAVAYVRSRTRTYIHANAALPQDDPQVLDVVGRISTSAFAVRAATLAAATRLDDAVATAALGVALDKPTLDAAENAVYQAQVHAVDQVPAAATLLFEVGERPPRSASARWTGTGGTPASSRATTRRSTRRGRSATTRSPVAARSTRGPRTRRWARRRSRGDPRAARPGGGRATGRRPRARYGGRAAGMPRDRGSMTTHAPSRPQLDTTPLTGRIDRDDLRRFRREFTARFPVLVSPLFVLGRIALGILAVLAIPLGGVLLLTGGLGAIVAEDPETRGDALGMTVFAIPLFGAGVFFAWRLIRTRRRRSRIRSHYRLARFGRINGLSYTPGPVSDGHMGSAARGMSVTRVMRPRTARPVEFGNHELSRGSRASGITQYGGYAMIGLRRELPHIQVISNRTRLRRALTPTVDVARSQRLELEGDFDRHAALYCPDGYERDALYLFTPDVMAVLVDRVRGFDVEIRGDRLLLRSPADIVTLDPDRWHDVIDATAALMAKVDRWERWRDDRLRSLEGEERSVLTASDEALAVPEPGKARRRGRRRRGVAAAGRRLRMRPTLGLLLLIALAAVFLGLGFLITTLP